MKNIKVELTGLTPILMNSPKGMIEKEQNPIVSTTKNYDLQEDAKRLLYINDKGLFVPAEAIKKAVIDASSYKKIGKYAANNIIAGGVFVIPSEISLGTKNYELDIRTVVIKRARIVKARPKINSWKINFVISYNENLIGDSKIIKQVLTEAGQRIGILDFRPQKKGSFGMFKITKWEEQ